MDGMTTTDPKLVERIAEAMAEAHLLISDGHYHQAGQVVLPIVAAAINEAVAARTAGIVAWLRADAADRIAQAIRAASDD